MFLKNKAIAMEKQILKNFCDDFQIEDKYSICTVFVSKIKHK